MICKWCGASMDPMETVCRRCGRETAAKSDCGGFYDLVPAARNIVPAMPVQQPVPQPVPKPASQPVTESVKKSPVSLVLGVLCCLLAILTVVAFVSGNNAKAENARLEQELEEIQEPKKEALSLAQQDVLVQLGLEQTDGVVSMKADADPAGTVVISCDPAMLTGKITAYTAQLDLPDGDTTAHAVINCDLGAQDTALQIGCTLDEGFGKSDLGFALDRLWYTNEEGKTVDLELPVGTEHLSVSKADGAVTVKLSDETIVQILEANELPRQTAVGCDLVRENSEKGSLTIRVEGICIVEES